MTKSTITREENIQAVFDLKAGYTLGLADVEILKRVARMALAAMDSEPMAWGNGCDKTVPAALRYLAENERPFGGESRFNAAHLYQLAREIELMAEAPLYRHAQPVLEIESEPVFTLEVARADYKGQKLGNHFGFITLDAARELKEGNYQLYAAQPAPVVPEKCPAEISDLLASHSDALFNDDDAQEIWNACRSAMLNGGKS